MNILLVDIDSIIPNLALMKISTYYKNRGDKVGFVMCDPDIVYISVILRKNRILANQSVAMIKALYPNALIDVGGPGYDLIKSLPNDIENCDPDYSIYPGIDYALGFTTRGCIRRCPFCIVPIKEGSLVKVNSIEKIYRPEFHAIKLLDNNILADPDNFKHVVDFCFERHIKLDVSQGLDIRLLTPELAKYVSKIHPMKSLTFAYDSPSYTRYVERGINLLKDAGVNVRSNVQFYVYCDNSTGEYGIDSAIDRCQKLKSWGTNAYVMLDINTTPSKQMKNLKRWANRKAIYWAIDFCDYDRGGYQ